MKKADQDLQGRDVLFDENKQLKKKTKIIFLALFITIIVLLCSVVVLHRLGYIRYPWEQTIMVGSNIKQGALPGMTEEELQEYLQRRADAANVSLKINSQPVFEDGSSEGTLLIQNPHYNLFDMVVRIYLGNDNTGTQVYDSGRIPPDHYIDRDKLSIHLEKGSHEAIAYISFFDGDTQLNTASINLNIIINN